MADPTRDPQEILREAKQKLRDLQAKICRSCKQPKTLYQSGFCMECYLAKAKEREEKRQNVRHKDDRGYVRIYDEDDKLVLEHRYVMERYLGRKLTKRETVIHRDGNRSNNDLSNLLLSMKGGTPLENLKCTNCGAVGEFEYDENSD